MITMILAGVLCLMLYFLPTLISWRGHAAPATFIFLINTFLGWTIIGWVFALILSVTNTSFGNFAKVFGWLALVRFFTLIAGASGV